MYFCGFVMIFFVSTNNEPIIVKGVFLFMCRSIANGGRRCPCSTDPVKRAAYNARRRELRRARKQGLPDPPLASEMNTLTVTPPPDNKSASALSPSVVARSERFMVNRQRLHTIDEKVRAITPLGENMTAITFGDEPYSDVHLTNLGSYTTRNTGELVDRGLVSSISAHGTIMRDKLDAQSYTSFGFTDNFEDYYVPESERTTKGVGRVYDVVFHQRLSRAEYDSIVEDNPDAKKWKGAVFDYTDSTYEILNDILHRKQNVNYDHTEEIYGHDREKLNNSVYAIDSYLKDAPKVHKKVLRVMGHHSGAFVKYGNYDNVDVIGEWLKDENVKLGSEFSFDGYLSTTSDPKVLSNFSSLGHDDSNALVFEILTPEGANVSSMSAFTKECETLLPRGGKYVVVGQHEVPKAKPGRFLRVLQLVAVDNDGKILDEDTVFEPAPVHWGEDGSYVSGSYNTTL